MRNHYALPLSAVCFIQLTVGCGDFNAADIDSLPDAAADRTEHSTPPENERTAVDAGAAGSELISADNDTPVAAEQQSIEELTILDAPASETELAEQSSNTQGASSGQPDAGASADESGVSVDDGWSADAAAFSDTQERNPSGDDSSPDTRDFSGVAESPDASAPGSGPGTGLDAGDGLIPEDGFRLGQDGGAGFDPGGGFDFGLDGGFGADEPSRGFGGP